MVNVSSLFGQIVSGLFSAVNFDNLVAKWGAERHAKGFRSKTQLISMLFCVRPYGAIEIPVARIIQERRRRGEDQDRKKHRETGLPALRRA